MVRKNNVEYLGIWEDKEVPGKYWTLANDCFITDWEAIPDTVEFDDKSCEYYVEVKYIGDKHGKVLLDNRRS